MEREYFIILYNKKNTLACLNKILETAKEFQNINRAKDTKGSFFKIKKKAKEDLIILMALIMMGNGSMIFLMGMVDIIIMLQMKTTLEIGKKVKCMDKANIHFKILPFIPEILN